MSAVTFVVTCWALLATIEVVAERRRRKRAEDYKPDWHPCVRTSKTEAKVSIVKPSFQKPGEKVEVAIGSHPVGADDFDDAMRSLMTKAEDRAAMMRALQEGQYR